ncbi:MAG: NADH-dependent [FeFe] hydrogenase, group A6 [Syntrophomonadaceae bacterium]|jgi:NADH-quinone oxidoreductase subunit G
MSEVNIQINDVKLSAPADYTILQAARLVNVDIPTLCHMNLHDNKKSKHEATCRVCMVEIEGRRNLAPACITKISEGMKIKTNTPRAIRGRRTSVELLLSDHPLDCLICEKNQNCELQQLAAKLGIKEIKYQGEMSKFEKDCSSYSIQRNPDKCIRCRRCEIMCNEVQTCGVLSASGRGFETIVKPTFGMPLIDTACTFCGQCVAVCPTAALSEKSVVSEVWDAINNPDKFVVVQTAPAVRVALGEEFGMEPGHSVTGKMVSLLRSLGFDKVFDTDFAADLTIMEEATELIHRLNNNGKLPIMTSCCPGWIKFFEHQFPDLMDIPSSCKSPHQMFGAIIKSYYAEKLGKRPDQMVVVSVMPCVAKKFEAARPELITREGCKNVDYVITTRELAKMAKEAAIDFMALPDEDFDHPLGESTGAAVIFGATGGVLEAALRTAYEWLTGTTLEKVEFEELRGMKGIKSATIKINDMDVRVAVASGLGNARTLLQCIREGRSRYHAIEIMACPGGCIGGGGQPYNHCDIEVLKARTQALYEEDRNKPIRKSHENPLVQQLYKDFLGEPYGEKAHKLLHTHYIKRDRI